MVHSVGKILLMTSKLSIELRKKLIWFYIWRIEMYRSEIWKLEILNGSIRKVALKKIKWSENVTYKEVLHLQERGLRL